jgi:CubicO group peptidase (beta-lactamase class C family)
MNTNLVNQKSKIVCVAALAFISFGWAQNIPTAKPESVGLSSKRLDYITQVFQAEVDKGAIPGVILQINRNGKLAYSAVLGFKDKAKNQPLTKDSIFRIYSMTKPMASVAAMQLVEDGKIQLTDPISKYLPEFKDMQVSVAKTNDKGETYYDAVPALKPITVQDLLRHTSGIAYPEITKNPVIKREYINGGLYVPEGTDYDQRRLSPKEFVTSVAHAPLSTQPGSNWEYSMSVDVLGRVIEAASGQRLGEYMQAHLFKPLDMKDTGFKVPADKVARIAQPFSVDPTTKQPIKLLDVTVDPANDSGGAGGVSTAADYMNFVSMLLNGGELNGQRVISPMTLKLMTSDQLGTRTAIPLSPGQLLMGVNGYTFGLGFMVRQGAGLSEVPGSEGEFMWAGAAGTFFWVDPKEKIGVVMMTQVPGPIRPYYRRLLKQLVGAAVVK